MTIQCVFASLSGPAIDLLYVSVYVNKQNCRIWGTENPHADIEKLKHPKRVIFFVDFGPEA